MWYDIEVTGVEKGRFTYRIRVKWWSPSFWLEGYRTLRSAGATVSESVYFTLVLISQFARRK